MRGISNRLHEPQTRLLGPTPPTRWYQRGQLAIAVACCLLGLATGAARADEASSAEPLRILGTNASARSFSDPATVRLSVGWRGGPDLFSVAPLSSGDPHQIVLRVGERAQKTGDSRTLGYFSESYDFESKPYVGEIQAVYGINDYHGGGPGAVAQGPLMGVHGLSFSYPEGGTIGVVAGVQGFASHRGAGETGRAQGGVTSEVIGVAANSGAVGGGYVHSVWGVRAVGSAGDMPAAKDAAAGVDNISGIFAEGTCQAGTAAGRVLSAWFVEPTLWGACSITHARCNAAAPCPRVCSASEVACETDAGCGGGGACNRAQSCERICESREVAALGLGQNPLTRTASIAALSPGTNALVSRLTYDGATDTWGVAASGVDIGDGTRPAQALQFRTKGGSWKEVFQFGKLYDYDSEGATPMVLRGASDGGGATLLLTKKSSAGSPFLLDLVNSGQDGAGLRIIDDFGREGSGERQTWSLYSDGQEDLVLASKPADAPQVVPLRIENRAGTVRFLVTPQVGEAPVLHASNDASRGPAAWARGSVTCDSACASIGAGCEDGYFVADASRTIRCTDAASGTKLCLCK